jgi:excisionase family DNA binding protein
MSRDPIVPDKRLFRLDEVARLLDVDVRTVRRMISAGRLAVVVVSQRVRRVPRESVAAVLTPGRLVDYRT